MEAETNPDIREGMEINLDLLNRALKDAGWESELDSDSTYAAPDKWKKRRDG